MARYHESRVNVSAGGKSGAAVDAVYDASGTDAQGGENFVDCTNNGWFGDSRQTVADANGRVQSGRTQIYSLLEQAVRGDPRTAADVQSTTHVDERGRISDAQGAGVAVLLKARNQMSIIHLYLAPVHFASLTAAAEAPAADKPHNGWQVRSKGGAFEMLN